MLDRTGAAFLAALQNLNELSERLAIGRENDDYLHRLANAAQNVAIAAREVYAEAREKDLLCSRKSFSRAGARESIARSKHTSLPDGYTLEARGDGTVVIRLPLRLSKRSHDSAFVCEPLDTLLARHASALPRFRECTIEFCHCYAASHQPADVRDHDNPETRAVLNVIERYLLTSDSSIYCSNVQTSCWGDRDQTVICIRPGKIPVFDLGAGYDADF
ncbi:MAG: DUF6100 family protein [Agathobaculum desmolans]|uniref:DUF6100 family protein n=1 Tax=Agathobaculum desmolans TaxID=39484 RepID=UPI0039962BDF